MAKKPDYTNDGPPMQEMGRPPRNLTVDEWKAEMAFQVLCILRRAGRDDPLLMHNCYFDALVEEVQSDFNTAFARSHD